MSAAAAPLALIVVRPDGVQQPISIPSDAAAGAAARSVAKTFGVSTFEAGQWQFIVERTHRALPAELQLRDAGLAEDEVLLLLPVDGYSPEQPPEPAALPPATRRAPLVVPLPDFPEPIPAAPTPDPPAPSAAPTPAPTPAPAPAPAPFAAAPTPAPANPAPHSHSPSAATHGGPDRNLIRGAVGIIAAVLLLVAGVGAVAALWPSDEPAPDCSYGQSDSKRALCEGSGFQFDGPLGSEWFISANPDRADGKSIWNFQTNQSDNTITLTYVPDRSPDPDASKITQRESVPSENAEVEKLVVDGFQQGFVCPEQLCDYYVVTGSFGALSILAEDSGGELSKTAAEIAASVRPRES